MGFKYTARVYADVEDTTALEQSVLALLAHRVDDRTGTCYPSVARIIAECHLSRSSVLRALSGLKGKGLVEWTSGGKMKGGAVRANLYVLKLPPPVPETARRRAHGRPTDTREGVQQTPTRVSHRHPQGCPTDTYKGITPTPHHTYGSSSGQPAASGNGRVDVSSSTGGEGMRSFMELFGAEAVAKPREPQRKPSERASVVHEAMRVAGVADEGNLRAFSSRLVGKSPEKCLEVIWRFESERNAGEWSNLRNPAAALMNLLAQVPTE